MLAGLRDDAAGGGVLAGHVTPNRIKLGLSIYGSVSGDWLIAWMQFQAEIAAYGKSYRGMTLMKGSCYVHMNSNQLVAAALEDDTWDYFLHLQDDQIPPEGVLERVGGYTDPVVGAMTFGRVMEHQQAVPGRFDGFNFARLSDEDAERLMDQPGLHPIGATSLGCTAIRRDVLETWNPDLGPWFQVPTWDGRSWGEDVWFCYQAAQQGWPVYVDTALVSPHVGAWKSDGRTFRARLVHDRRLRELQANEPAEPRESVAVAR